MIWILSTFPTFDPGLCDPGSFNLEDQPHLLERAGFTWLNRMGT